MQIALCGIGTEIGKTYASAAICELANLAYFKIIQAGLPQDKDLVASLCPKVRIYENGYTLQTPASPHLGLQLEKKSFHMKDILIPADENLLLECAGGLYSPIDNTNCMMDFLSLHKLPVLLVANEYLGSINHTILSLKELENRGLEVKALIFRGKDEGVFTSSADFISRYTRLTPIWLPFYDNTNQEEIFNKFKKDILDLKLS